jgi:hypothetical protein
MCYPNLNHAQAGYEYRSLSDRVETRKSCLLGFQRIPKLWLTKRLAAERL